MTTAFQTDSGIFFRELVRKDALVASPRNPGSRWACLLLSVGIRIAIETGRRAGSITCSERGSAQARDTSKILEAHLRSANDFAALPHGSGGSACSPEATIEAESG